MGRTAFFIDVVAVRLITDTDHLRTQFMEYFRRNRIARTIGGIDHQFQTAQVQMAWESGFTKLDIAVIRTINPARTAQTAGRLGFHFFIDFGFDFQLDFIAQLHTAFGKEFNAVVGINVMGSRNHHTGRQTQSAGQIRYTRSRQRAGLNNIDTGGGKTGNQRGFQHIA